MPSTARLSCFLLALLLDTAGALADTIALTGARVLTMVAAKPEASTIALVDGRFAAVGTEANMQPFLAGSI